jgi:hypothetical protein
VCNTHRYYLLYMLRNILILFDYIRTEGWIVLNQRLTLAVYKMPPSRPKYKLRTAACTSVDMTTGEHEYTPFKTKITKRCCHFSALLLSISIAIRFIHDV